MLERDQQALFGRKALRELQNQLPKLLRDNGFEAKIGEPRRRSKEDFEALKDMTKKHLASGYKLEKLTKEYISLRNDFDKVYHNRKSTQSNNFFELRGKLGEVGSQT